MFANLLHLVRDRSLARYLANNPTAYSELIAAVQDIPAPKPLLTPASTPHDDFSDEQAPTPLPSKSTAQEEDPRYDSEGSDPGDSCAGADHPRAKRATLHHHDVSPPSEANSNGHSRDPPGVVQPSQRLYTTRHVSYP